MSLTSWGTHTWSLTILRAVTTSTVGSVSTGPLFESSITFLPYSRIWRCVWQTSWQPCGHSWQSRDRWLQTGRCHESTSWLLKNENAPLSCYLQQRHPPTAIGPLQATALILDECGMLWGECEQAACISATEERTKVSKVAECYYILKQH